MIFNYLYNYRTEGSDIRKEGGRADFPDYMALSTSTHIFL